MTRDRLAEKLNAFDLTREQFDLLFSLLLKQDWGATELAVDPRGGFSFLLPGQTGLQFLFTENVWVLAQQEVESRFECVMAFLDKVLTPISDAISTSQIVAIIRAADWLAVGDAEGVLFKDHLVGDLWVIYAVDRPDTTITLSESNLAQIGLHRDELRPTAVTNLQRLLPEIECHGEGPWFSLVADGCYEASLLLLDSLWDRLEGQVDGDLIAAIPARDTLIFTGAKSLEGLSILRNTAKAIYAQGDHVVSDLLLRRVHGTWKLYE